MSRSRSRKNQVVKRDLVIRGNITEAEKRAFNAAKIKQPWFTTDSDFVLAASQALVAAHLKGQELQQPLRFLTQAQRDFLVKNGREDLL